MATSHVAASSLLPPSLNGSPDKVVSDPQAVWYLFFSYPTPLVHIIDFYITEPLAKATSGNAFNGSVFTLRDR